MPTISDVPQEISDMPQSLSDGPERRRTGLHAARGQGLMAVGAVLLMCAPVLPGLWRLVVLPALLLAPGYALLRLLRQPSGRQSIAIAVPASIVLIIIASLILDVSGVPLGPVWLGLMLGGMTAVFLAGSYALQLVASPPGRHRETPRRPEADGSSATADRTEVTRPR
jgi:hypothetical protein